MYASRRGPGLASAGERRRDCIQRLVVFAGLLVLLAGCQGDKTREISGPTSASPVMLTVRVLGSGAPIVGAICRALGGQGATDASGQVKLLLYPGFDVVQVTAPDYAAVDYRLSVPPSCSDGCSAVIEMPALDASLSLVATLSDPEAEPAARCRVRLDWSGWSLARHSLRTDGLPESVETDSLGRIFLTGLPANVPVVLDLLPFDADGDGRDDLAGTTPWEGMLSSADTTDVVIAGELAGTMTVVDTNIPDLPEALREVRDCGLRFRLASPVDTASTENRFRLRNQGGLDAPLRPRWTSDCDLELFPTSALPDPASQLIVALELKSARGRVLTWSSRLRWAPRPSCPPAAGFEGECGDIVSDLRWESPPTPDFDTRRLRVAWTGVVCAEHYDIYLHDDRGHPDWRWVLAAPARAIEMNVDLNLPAQFDYPPDDGRWTPLAGTEIQICIVPAGAAISLPGEPHPVLRVRDEAAPAIVQTAQCHSSANPEEGPALLQMRVWFDEFMAEGEPSFEILGTHDPGTMPPDLATTVWAWDPDRSAGTVEWTLAPGQDASGTVIGIGPGEARDLSGNRLSGNLPHPVVLHDVGVATSFEEGPGEWTADGLGWAWGTPRHGPGVHTGVACWATSLTGEYEGYWDGALTSPGIWVPAEEPRLRFWYWCDLERCSNERCDDVVLSVVEGDAESVLRVYSGALRTWIQEDVSLSRFAGRFIELRFRFHSDPFVVGTGFFLDDVTVSRDGAG